MTPLCRLFRSYGGGIAGEASLRNRVRWSSCSKSASERRFSMGNNIGKVFSVILLQWLNRLLELHRIGICCNPRHSVVANILKVVISSSVFPPLLSPVQSVPLLVVTILLFVLGLILELPYKSYVFVSQSPHKICKFVIGSCNEVDVIC